MQDFTRRTLLQGGTALAATGMLTGPALFDFAKAWAQRLALEGRARRQAHRDALEALRAGGRRCVQCDGRGVQGGHRHRDERVQRILRGRAAEGLGCGQHRLRSRPRLGPAHAAAAVPHQSAEDERRRRLSRQEIRRLDRCGRQDLQAGQRLARHSRRDQRRLHDVPQVGARQGRLQGIPEGFSGLPRDVQGPEEEQHAGRLRARACLGRRQFVAALGPLGPRRLHRRSERQDRHQFAGDGEGAGILQGAVRRLHPGHGVLERFLQQQGVPRRRGSIARRTASRSTLPPRPTRARRNSPRTPITRSGRSDRSASRPSCSLRCRSSPSTSPNIRTRRRPSSPLCWRRRITRSGWMARRAI